jgi:hypothetical protein
VSDPPPSSGPVQREAAWADMRLTRSRSDDNGVLPCKVSSSSSSSLSEVSAHGQEINLPPRPPRIRISKSAEEAAENRSVPSSGSPADADVAREINAAGTGGTIDRGPPRTVVIPPPMAPYAQLCYNRAEDRMVTLMVGADHVVVRDKSGEKREGGGNSLHYLASPAPTPTMKPGVDSASGDGTQEDRDVTHFLPEVRTKRCDVSTHDDTITDDGSGSAEADDEGGDDDDGAEAEDDDDELVYSRSSGLSTAFSMETIVNPSTAHSRSSFGETDTSSRNATNTSRSSSGGGDAGSESTVVMYNNASRCRRSPQEIIWMDEAWLYECESVYGFRSSDRLALLHDVASGDDLDAYLYDADDDAMSDSCGKLLLMRSVALCKGKLKPTPGFVASSPKRSASGASSSSHKSAAAGFLSGKLFEYSKL